MVGVYRVDLLAGRSALVVGVANRNSIAWGIAQGLAEAGAKLVLAFQTERFRDAVTGLASTLPGASVFQMDVTRPDEVKKLFAYLREIGGLDILVHSVAFSPREALTGRVVDTTLEDFNITLAISAGSLITLAKAAEPLMVERGGGTILTMTYLGGERVIPHYNAIGVAKAALQLLVLQLAYELGVKNIRVNAISAGPMNTLAARGISGFQAMRHEAYEHSALRRETTLEEVGRAAVFFCSDASSSTTGQVLYVDAGSHLTPPLIPASSVS